MYFVVPLLHASFVIIRPPSSSTCLMVLVVRLFARPVGFCVKVFCTQWWRDASDDDNDDNQPTNPHKHTHTQVNTYLNIVISLSLFFFFLSLWLLPYYFFFLSSFCTRRKTNSHAQDRLCSLTLCGSHGGHESGKLQPNECGNRAKFHTTKGSLEVSFPVFQLGVGGFCNNSSSRRIRISSHRRRRRRRRRASVRNNRCCQQSACVGEASFFSFLFFTHLFSSTLLSFHTHSLLSFFLLFPPREA